MSFDASDHDESRMRSVENDKFFPTESKLVKMDFFKITTQNFPKLKTTPYYIQTRSYLHETACAPS